MDRMDPFSITERSALMVKMKSKGNKSTEAAVASIPLLFLHNEVASTLLLLLAGTGMGVSEGLGLRWSDIDRKEGLNHVRRAWTGAKLGRCKTAASRSTVPCIASLSEHLRQWRNESLFNGDEDFVFPSEVRGGKIPRNGGVLLEDYVIPSAITVGVIKAGGRIGWHTLRHSLASYLVSAGFNPTTAQRMPRQSNVNMTLQVYSHGCPSDSMQAQDAVMREMLKPTGLIQ
jgi:integrase